MKPENCKIIFSTAASILKFFKFNNCSLPIYWNIVKDIDCIRFFLSKKNKIRQNWSKYSILRHQTKPSRLGKLIYFELSFGYGILINLSQILPLKKIAPLYLINFFQPLIAYVNFIYASFWDRLINIVLKPTESSK